MKRTLLCRRGKEFEMNSGCQLAEVETRDCWDWLWEDTCWQHANQGLTTHSVPGCWAANNKFTLCSSMLLYVCHVCLNSSNLNHSNHSNHSKISWFWGWCSKEQEYFDNAILMVAMIKAKLPAVQLGPTWSNLVHFECSLNNRCHADFIDSEYFRMMETCFNMFQHVSTCFMLSWIHGWPMVGRSPQAGVELAFEEMVKVGAKP